MSLQHVNFHTLYNSPVFENEHYDHMMRHWLPQVVVSRGLLCVAWEIMPTRVYMVVQTFPDLPCSIIMKHVKGDTSRAFFAAFPDMRLDMLGGHLWRKGYFTTDILSYRQYLATVEYIQGNRGKAGLLPPVALKPASD